MDYANSQYLPITIIKGSELSAESSKGILHILGYNIDIAYQPMLDSLENLRKIRAKRNNHIVEKLTSLGIDIHMDDFKDISKNSESLGRPHIASILVNKKIVDSIEQAFNLFLGKNKKAYVPKKLYSAEEAISLIHHAGGIAFVAHPATLKRDGKEFETYLHKLIDQGLDGIEVFAPLHSKRQIGEYLSFAKDYNLMISAGSDFHGSNKPSVELGICTEGKKMPSNQLSSSLFNSFHHALTIGTSNIH
jgi:predicted metal-dependent phosphoesterase TrpH